VNLFIILFVLFSIFTSNPAENTEVFLERGTQGEITAFQKTGEKGEASFKHLDAASYSIYIRFPQQEGKYIKEKRQHRTLSKANYNPKKRTYYYQGEEGFFSIKFSGINKIEKESFTATFKEERGEEIARIEVARFGAKRNGASISLTVKAITAKQFKNATEKGQDISTLSLPTIR
jgi:hypothetical protein